MRRERAEGFRARALSVKGGALSAFQVCSSCARALVFKGLHSQLPRAPPNFTTIPKMLCKTDEMTHFLRLEGWGRPSRFLPPLPRFAKGNLPPLPPWEWGGGAWIWIGRSLVAAGRGTPDPQMLNDLVGPTCLWVPHVFSDYRGEAMYVVRFLFTSAFSLHSARVPADAPKKYLSILSVCIHSSGFALRRSCLSHPIPGLSQQPWSSAISASQFYLPPALLF